MVGKALGWGQQRDAEKNSAPMVANVVAQREQARKDLENKELATNDLDAIRKADAE